jgi:hypothetical protein
VLGLHLKRVEHVAFVQRTRKTVKAKDPPVDRSAPELLGTNLQGNRVRVVPPADGKPVILVLGRQCTSCEVGGLARIAKAVPERCAASLVFVTAGDRQALDKLSRRVLRRFSRYSYARYAASVSAYNLAWSPRVYLVDAQGVLRYQQPVEDGSSTAARVAAGKARSLMRGAR